ncbi:hypothetical protein SAMN05216526_0109 [Ectothiorhodosinus mongolicus]|uniref:Uncharacterized protein n=1 Tax=Ectothiorhodosinus mongolicus TaxID=233100 RepID=A0A1R3VM50_9GAMM|nr:hypothetical protein [Ectothiorhodosinus mongolicus]ULX57795.1 hypothetical protein CKX93_09115 [Ectothiorhodosinus mongolicus]SIT65659.1 hypothetical protein SAMN05216526_0109 [Ectothiorhodosinus mongolicus]
MNQTYPISNTINLSFGPLEDRLVLTAERGEHGPVRVLLTRRMVLIMLKQITDQLPKLMGLQQTPQDYWQEAMRISHQNALNAKQQADQAQQQAANEDDDAQAQPPNPLPPPDTPVTMYLATGLTLEQREDNLIMAFQGLLLPEAMTQPCQHIPILAMPLQLENVHQLLQLILQQTIAAEWNLPMDLPWVDERQEPMTATSSATTH